MLYKLQRNYHNLKIVLIIIGNGLNMIEFKRVFKNKLNNWRKLL